MHRFVYIVFLILMSARGYGQYSRNVSQADQKAHYAGTVFEVYAIEDTDVFPDLEDNNPDLGDTDLNKDVIRFVDRSTSVILIRSYGLFIQKLTLPQHLDLPPPSCC